MRRISIDGIDEVTVERYALDRILFDRPSQTTADLHRLDGKCAIVTGGGGEGLGHAVCHRLAEQGAIVAVFDIDQAAAEETAQDLIDRWSVQAFPITADVGDAQQAQRAVAEVVDRIGKIDILVNNAGGSGGVTGSNGARHAVLTPLAETSFDEIDALVRVNLLSALYMTRATLDVMLPKKSGRIINISSESARTGLPGSSVYTACKAGLIGITRSLAIDLGPAGISVVCVSPGLIARQRMMDALERGDEFGDALDISFQRTSVGRIALADEVASVVAFLASPAAALVHGTTVSVSGGIAD
jgi:3-oxoacyl-[acyl-carrier protein] reductase